MEKVLNNLDDIETYIENFENVYKDPDVFAISVALAFLSPSAYLPSASVKGLSQLQYVFKTNLPEKKIQKILNGWESNGYATQPMKGCYSATEKLLDALRRQRFNV